MNIGRESEYVEFKESTAETDKGIDSMASMLNKHGKGTLYFGVRNNGDICGQEIGDQTLNRLSQNISRELRPQCRYEVMEKASTEGKHFIEVVFSGDRCPYSSRGRYFLRFHDEDRVMDNETLRQYYLDQRSDYSLWERADSGCGIDCVDGRQLEDYVQRSVARNRLALSWTTPEAVLGRLGLLHDEKHLNNAGNVLFSKDRPVRVKLARFASETRLTILNLQLFEGNVFECIERCMEFLAANIDWKVMHTGQVRRTEEPEIPMKAAREIIVNAFSHGDYNTGTDFELDIYSDRVCIYSPGMFPRPYTPEDFAQRNLEPVPLNITISDILFRDGTIEQISTGFERVFSECRSKGIRYEYTETATGFRFTFFRTGGRQKASTSGSERKILDCMKENGDISTDELAARTGVTIRTVQRSIKSLKERGVIGRIESNEGSRWAIWD